MLLFCAKLHWILASSELLCAYVFFLLVAQKAKIVRKPHGLWFWKNIFEVNKNKKFPSSGAKPHQHPSLPLLFGLKISSSSSDPHIYSSFKHPDLFFSSSEGEKMKNRTSVFLHILHWDWFSCCKTVTAGWSSISRPSSPLCPAQIQSRFKPWDLHQSGHLTSRTHSSHHVRAAVGKCEGTVLMMILSK